MTNLDSVWKSRNYFAYKGLYSQSYGFPSSMYGCESWTRRKQAECQRMYASELLCWRRLLRIPWTERRSNWSILEEINPTYSLEGLMLKLKLQYFGHLMRRVDSIEKILMLGKIGGRRRGRQRMIWLDGFMDSMDVSLSKFWQIVKDSEAWRATIPGVAKTGCNSLSNKVRQV